MNPFPAQTPARYCNHELIVDLEYSSIPSIFPSFKGHAKKSTGDFSVFEYAGAPLAYVSGMESK